MIIYEGYFISSGSTNLDGWYFFICNQSIHRHQPANDWATVTFCVWSTYTSSKPKTSGPAILQMMYSRSSIVHIPRTTLISIRTCYWQLLRTDNNPYRCLPKQSRRVPREQICLLWGSDALPIVNAYKLYYKTLILISLLFYCDYK